MVQQETELSLTNRATYLCKRNGVVDLKHAPPHICYHAEFGRSMLKDVGINTGEPTKLGRAGTFGMADVADSKLHASPRHVLPHQIWYFCDKG